MRYWLSAHSEDRVVNYDALTYGGNLQNLRDVEARERYQFA